MKRQLITLAIISGLIASSCQKGFLTDLAVNPNQPSTASASPILVLPPALINTSTTIQTSWDNVALWFGILNWKGGYAINTPTLTYVETTTSDNGSWFSLYSNAENYYFIQQYAATHKNNDNYGAIATIMKAVDFEYLVDNFNNVPYFDALKGSTGKVTEFFPKYDDAQSIYTDLVSQLDSAIALINSSASSATEAIPGGDVMFGGTMSLWASFANTVKLRILLQQSEVAGRQSYISGEIQKTTSTPYLGPGQNAFVQPGYANQDGPNGGNQENQFYLDFGFNQNGNPNLFYPEQGAGQAGIDFLKRTNDSVRLPLFYTPVPSTTTFLGDYFGLLPVFTISNTGPGMLQSPGQPSIIMTASESLFMQAEAALRGYISGGVAAAQTFYQEAVTESFAYLNGDYSGYSPGSTGSPSTLSQTEAAAYYNQTGVKDVSWTTEASFSTVQTDPNLRTIIMQKWIAMNANTPMAYWNDYRRFQDVSNTDGTTGLPDVPLSKNPSLSYTSIPFRVYYPQDEYDKNSTNVPASTANMQYSKVFWMQ
ncbi:MAG TPA: SusD/RagB family nutrient-binding outer membrane lipoprotein [Chitinophagaceae bacterium]|nr:SusD/RagB family nutrient-binding outer membrane lipoprotein [Chitinophagaceae bacterium]